MREPSSFYEILISRIFALYLVLTQLLLLLFFLEMRKHILSTLLVIAALFSSCAGKTEKEYIIKGEVRQARLEGQRVFLVPVVDSIKSIVGVDSCEIKDMKFQFKGNEEYVADIRIDWHSRYGTQNLLVVTEPGITNVLIDSTSIGGGTPQNEVLQEWKDFAIMANRVMGEKSLEVRMLRAKGDTTTANSLRDSLRQYRQFYKEQCRAIAMKAPEGTNAREFILSKYPEN